MLPLIALVLVASQTPAPPPLLDAKTFIARLKSTACESAIEEKERAYLGEVEAYIAQSPSMPAKEAAKRWFGLIADGEAVPVRRMEGSFGGAMATPIGDFSTAFAALPRPEDWPAIVKMIDELPDSNRKLVLQLLFARLQGDDSLVLKLCDLLEAKDSGFFERTRWGALRRLQDTRGQLDLFKDDVSKENRYVEGDFDDLIESLGPQLAPCDILPILQQAIRDIGVTRPYSAALARRTFLDNIATIKTPQWLFAQGADLDYVRNLVTRYGLDALIQDQQAERAQEMYFVGLLNGGNVADAIAYLRKVRQPARLYYLFEGPGVVPNLSRIYSALVQIRLRAPDCDTWNLFLDVEQRTGHIQGAIQAVENELAKPETVRQKRFQLLDNLVDLYAAKGDVAAFEAIRTRILDLQPRPNEGNETWSVRRIAEALGDRKILEEETARELSSVNPDTGLAEQLTKCGRLDLAAQLLMNGMKAAKRSGDISSRGDLFGDELCRIYYQAGRAKDVLRLLRYYPYWSAPDLSQIVSRPKTDPYGNQEEPSLGFVAAWAFAKTGSTQLAERTLELALFNSPEQDDAFELLNRLEGAAALPLYQRIRLSHPYLCRPLVWKADLMLQLGRTSEAESDAREAIADDPLDDIRVSSRRLLGYHVLAAVLRKKGELAGAASCENRYRAANLAERANKLLELDLLPQAAAIFQKATQLSREDLFAEEHYSICLQKQGRLGDAGPHYRRCFQLLPQAVCRMAPQRWTDADRLLTSDLLPLYAPILEHLDPTSPRPNVVFAKALYEEQIGHPKAALDLFSQCLKLDSGFAAADLGIAQLGLAGATSKGQAERAAQRYLDLTGSLNDPDLESFSDLGPAYLSLARRLISQPMAKSLFPLHSKEQPNWFGLAPPWNYIPHRASDPIGTILVDDPAVSEIVQSYRWSRQKTP